MKAFLSFCVLSILLILPGCAVWDSIRGKPGGQPAERTVSTQDLQKRNVELEQEIQRIKDENELALARSKDENRRLTEKIKTMQEELQRLREKEGLLDTTGGEGRRSSSMSPAGSSSGGTVDRDLDTVKIKLLSGTGELDSARSMAVRLRQMGYKIQSIDFAPRKNFTENTVYFNSSQKARADRLAEALGPGTEVKAMTWASSFDLIVVTGKK